MIHSGFESRKAVILKVCHTLRPTLKHDLTSTQTPNRYLQPDDIPTIDRNLSDEVSYPPDNRYTLQWLIPDQNVEAMIPSNCDAYG